jgi:hypothetical protein
MQTKVNLYRQTNVEYEKDADFFKKVPLSDVMMHLQAGTDQLTALLELKDATNIAATPIAAPAFVLLMKDGGKLYTGLNLGLLRLLDSTHSLSPQHAALTLQLVHAFSAHTKRIRELFESCGCFATSPNTIDFSQQQVDVLTQYVRAIDQQRTPSSSSSFSTLLPRSTSNVSGERSLGASDRMDGLEKSRSDHSVPGALLPPSESSDNFDMSRARSTTDLPALRKNTTFFEMEQAQAMQQQQLLQQQQQHQGIQRTSSRSSVSPGLANTSKGPSPQSFDHSAGRPSSQTDFSKRASRRHSVKDPSPPSTQGPSPTAQYGNPSFSSSFSSLPVSPATDLLSLDHSRMQTFSPPGSGSGGGSMGNMMMMMMGPTPSNAMSPHSSLPTAAFSPTQWQQQQQQAVVGPFGPVHPSNPSASFSTLPYGGQSMGTSASAMQPFPPSTFPAAQPFGMSTPFSTDPLYAASSQPTGLTPGKSDHSVDFFQAFGEAPSQPKKAAAAPCPFDDLLSPQSKSATSVGGSGVANPAASFGDPFGSGAFPPSGGNPLSARSASASGELSLFGAIVPL